MPTVGYRTYDDVISFWATVKLNSTTCVYAFSWATDFSVSSWNFYQLIPRMLPLSWSVVNPTLPSVLLMKGKWVHSCSFL